MKLQIAQPVLFTAVFLLGFFSNNNSFAQCDTPLPAFLTIEYDCTSGAAEVMLVPESPFTGLLVLGWDISDGYDNPDVPSYSPIWFGAFPFPGSYTATATTFDYVNPPVTHCFEIDLGTCPEPEAFDIVDADCNDANGSICVVDELYEDAVFSCGPYPSVDGCIDEIDAGSHFCILGMPVETYLTVTYTNLNFVVGSNAFEVTIDETGTYSNCEGAELTSSITGGTGPFVYDWTWPGWLTGEPDDSEITLDGGYGYITLEVTDEGTGCVIETDYAFLGNNCLGYDLDDNEVVNVTDLLDFMADFGSFAGGCADFDGNGIVNVLDLVLFLSGYGIYC